MKKIKNISITRSGNGCYFSNHINNINDPEFKRLAPYYNLKNYHVTITINFIDNTSIQYDNKKDHIDINNLLAA